MFAVGEIDADLEQCERAISDMVLPSTMGAFDSAAFTHSFLPVKGQIRMKMKHLRTLRTRIKTRCLNYAIQMEGQLKIQQKGQMFLESVQNDTNNFFKERSLDVYRKLQKASELYESSDAEDASLLLTEVRKALKSAADHFYPPVLGRIVCSDGKERSMGKSNILIDLKSL